MGNLWLLFFILCLYTSGMAQDFSRAEYFFDTDPGAGNGTPIMLSTTASPLLFTASISTASLSPGFHFLGIRVKEVGGSWSIFESRGIYISTTVSNAANLIEAEYFIDSDPGAGNGTNILVIAGSTVNFTISIATGSLSPGFHILAIRIKGTDGKWSPFESRGFYISDAVNDASDIIASEYFFDNDPGNGNGIAIPVTPGASASFTVNLPTTSLQPGFHFLAIRTKGLDDRWGIFEARGFYVSSEATDASDIIAAEYFFDADPGAGNATSFTISSGSNSTFTVNLPATSLLPGFHFLTIRTKGTDGKWGLFETRGFYVGTQSTDAPNIIAAEYFFDTDPGEGNGLPLTISTPGAIIIQNFSILIPTNLPAGVHTVSLRVQDSSGKWSFKETGTFNVISNLLPNAIAGVDQFISLPSSSTILNGTASSDPDGNIATFSWTKISGPAIGTIANANQAIATAENLFNGVYVFELTVTDDNGTIDKDTLNITVNGIVNQSPQAEAGTDQIITLPTAIANLDGSASADTDGTIAIFTWLKISGPSSGIIANANQSIATASALSQGVYKFEITITDNNGAIDKDTVQVTVNAAANQQPIANAGADQTIILPTASVTLNGSASIDPDGALTNFLWRRISGPAVATITNDNQSIAALSNLITGVYSYELIVTDNSGAIDKDTVQITVNATANLKPKASAGPDLSITIPDHTITLNGSSSLDTDGNISNFTWTKISGPAAGNIVSPNQSITIVNNLAQGTYQFELMITDNSSLTDKDTVQVSVNPAISTCPPAPTITQIGSILVCNPVGFSYQWFKEGIRIDGEISQILEITVVEFGLYAVEINGNGCTIRSSDFIYLITDAKAETDGFQVYPNPVYDNVTINTPAKFSGSQITLIDLMGRKVMQVQLSGGMNEIEMSHFSQGIYYLYLNEKFVFKIQKL